MSNYKMAQQYKNEDYLTKFWQGYQKPKPTAAGMLIAEAMERRGITYAAIFKFIPLKSLASMVSYWKNGSHPLPMKHVNALARALGLDRELLAQAAMQDSMGARRYRQYVNTKVTVLEEEDME